MVLVENVEQENEMQVQEDAKKLSEKSSFVKLRLGRCESHQVKDHPFEELQVLEEVLEEQVRKVHPRKDEGFEEEIIDSKEGKESWTKAKQETLIKS